MWFLKRAYVTNGDVNLARLRESRGTGARRFYKQRVRHDRAWAVPEAEVGAEAGQRQRQKLVSLQ